MAALEPEAWSSERQYHSVIAAASLNFPKNTNIGILGRLYSINFGAAITDY